MSNQRIKIRVIVPVFRCTTLLRNCIKSIQQGLTSYPFSEIIVVDNGENSDLLSILSGLNIRIIQADEKPSAAYARNAGATDFENGIIVFIDSDVIINSDCIQKLLQPLIENQVEAAIGNYSSQVDGLTFAQKYKQLYIHYVYSRLSTSIRNDFWTAICAVQSDTFHELNGFDTSFVGANGEDQEFGIRLTQNLKKTLMVPSAKGIHLHNYSLRGIFRNDYVKGLRALRNINLNKVPLNDNRHANKKARVSVFLAGLSALVLMLSFFYPLLFAVSLLLWIFWLLTKSGMYSLFYSSGGAVFMLKSIVLTYLLEFVRIASILVFCLSIVKDKIRNQIFNTKFISEYE